MLKSLRKDLLKKFISNVFLKLLNKLYFLKIKKYKNVYQKD